MSSTTSKGVTPSSSLLRAHAPNQFPPLEFVSPHLSPKVLAGCCEPLLETGSSRRYLCKCFSGCLSHGSRRVAGCICLDCTPKLRHELKGQITLNGGEQCLCPDNNIPV